MKRKNLLLAALFFVLFFGYLAVTLGKTTAKAPDYEEKAAASALTADCFQMIKERKLELGIQLNETNDINKTGMIGQDFTGITTTLGNIESKRTATNPNMTAVILDMFHELGLKPGDTVAVNCSGSFPTLNIAVLCAAETAGLNAVMISSFGASTYGANDPEFTYLDMEHYLYENGMISNKSAYFSIGGNRDVGTDMIPELRDGIVERIKGYGYEFLYDDDLISNINARYEIYNSGPEIKCFINVGGNDASFGDSSVMVHAGGGILTKLSEKDNSTGLVQLFLKDNVPVIHILNLKSLAAEYGMPIDPSPIPEIGDGGVYYIYQYHKPLAAAILLAAAVLLFMLFQAGKNGSSSK